MAQETPTAVRPQDLLQDPAWRDILANPQPPAPRTPQVVTPQDLLADPAWQEILAHPPPRGPRALDVALPEESIVPPPPPANPDQQARDKRILDALAQARQEEQARKQREERQALAAHPVTVIKEGGASTPLHPNRTRTFIKSEELAEPAPPPITPTGKILNAVHVSEPSAPLPTTGRIINAPERIDTSSLPRTTTAMGAPAEPEYTPFVSQRWSQLSADERAEALEQATNEARESWLPVIEDEIPRFDLVEHAQSIERQERPAQSAAISPALARPAEPVSIGITAPAPIRVEPPVAVRPAVPPTPAARVERISASTEKPMVLYNGEMVEVNPNLVKLIEETLAETDPNKLIYLDGNERDNFIIRSDISFDDYLILSTIKARRYDEISPPEAERGYFKIGRRAELLNPEDISPEAQMLASQIQKETDIDTVSDRFFATIRRTVENDEEEEHLRALTYERAADLVLEAIRKSKHPTSPLATVRIEPPHAATPVRGLALSPEERLGASLASPETQQKVQEAYARLRQLHLLPKDQQTQKTPEEIGLVQKELCDLLQLQGDEHIQAVWNEPRPKSTDWYTHIFWNENFTTLDEIIPNALKEPYEAYKQARHSRDDAEKNHPEKVEEAKANCRSAEFSIIDTCAQQGNVDLQKEQSVRDEQGKATQTYGTLIEQQTNPNILELRRNLGRLMVTGVEQTRSANSRLLAVNAYITTIAGDAHFDIMPPDAHHKFVRLKKQTGHDTPPPPAAAHPAELPSQVELLPAAPPVTVLPPAAPRPPVTPAPTRVEPPVRIPEAPPPKTGVFLTDLRTTLSRETGTTAKYEASLNELIPYVKSLKFRNENGDIVPERRVETLTLEPVGSKYLQYAPPTRGVVGKGVIQTEGGSVDFAVILISNKQEPIIVEKEFKVSKRIRVARKTNEVKAQLKSLNKGLLGQLDDDIPPEWKNAGYHVQDNNVMFRFEKAA